MKKSKVIIWLAIIFFLGGLAGMLGSQLFLPWLAGVKPFDKIGWIVRSKDGTIIINKTERVIVEKSEADLEIIGRLQNSAVAIRGQRANKILTEGSGFILTSDGLIATANILLPKAVDRVAVFWNQKEYAAKTLKRDAANGLVLLKIEEVNLPVVSLGNDSSKLGEEIFSVGARILDSDIVSLSVKRGYLASLAPDLTVDFKTDQLSSGGLISDIDGNVLGLGLVGQGGDVKIVSADKIRELMKL